jgi:homoserine/homoserine lactone efflux protein
MNTSTLLAFALVALVTVVTPGPTVLLALEQRLASRAAYRGHGHPGGRLVRLRLDRRGGLGPGRAAGGIGDWPLGVVLKWLGVVYLAFLGLQLLRARQQARGRA